MLPLTLSPRLILAGLAAIITAAVLWAGYSWAHGRGIASERAKWEEATRQAGEQFAAALEAQQAELEALEIELGKARRGANKTREKLNDAIQTDQPSRDWASEPIPSRVRHALGDPSVPADPSQPD